MPTYTILGATGGTGGAILQLLLRAPDTTIQAYVRSKAKLLSQNSDLDKNPKVKIFEGAITEIPLLASAIPPGTDAVFNALGINENTPGIRIQQDSAYALVAAMTYHMSQHSDYKPPKLVLLSSGAMNPQFCPTGGASVDAIRRWPFSNVYGDLQLAADYLALHKAWLKHVTFAQPGILMYDEQRGHSLSTEECLPIIGYLDLAAGMIEIAEGKGSYDWKGVAVNSRGGSDIKFPWTTAPPRLMRGFMWHFFPSLHWACRGLGIVA